MLQGYTIYVKTDDPITGKMKNMTSAYNGTLYPGYDITIDAGYYAGNRKYTAVSLSSQTYATASAGEVLTSYNGWKSGNKINGSMPNKGTTNATLSANGTYVVPNGWHSGSGKVTQTLSTQSATTTTPSTSTKTIISSSKWTTGAQVVAGNANLSSSNIKKDVTIFGVTGKYSIHSGEPTYIFKDGKFMLGDDQWWLLYAIYNDSQFGDDSAGLYFVNPALTSVKRINDDYVRHEYPVVLEDDNSFSLLGSTLNQVKEYINDGTFGPLSGGSFRMNLHGWESYGENSHHEAYGHDNMRYLGFAFNCPQCTGKRVCMKFNISNLTDPVWTYCKNKSAGYNDEKYGLDDYELTVGWDYIGHGGATANKGYFGWNNSLNKERRYWCIDLTGQRPQYSSPAKITAPFSGTKSYDIKGTGPGALGDDMGIAFIYVAEPWPHLSREGYKEEWSGDATDTTFTISDIYLYYEDSPRTGASNEQYIWRTQDTNTGEYIQHSSPRRF